MTTPASHFTSKHGRPILVSYSHVSPLLLTRLLFFLNFHFRLTSGLLCITLSTENYLQNAHDDPLRPGLLGLGQSTAVGIIYAFSFLNYVTPLLGGIVADTWIGRYRAIQLGLAWVPHIFLQCSLRYSFRTYRKTKLTYVCLSSTTSATRCDTLGIAILATTAFTQHFYRVGGLPGYIVAICLMGFGAGGAKPNLMAFMSKCTYLTNAHTK